ncbi:chloride channel protein [Phytohalomonas tamaricis]|uniref:chloride channel protein n=1 Tax=Phytohalomonas tamaricis TaxID=2081032 RepID=UPI000D0AF28C|nr:chloride channel protein [Phytohalomonas tamaricis]
MPRRRLSASLFNLDNFRRQLASVDALPQLCLLGVLSGLLTGILMVLFRQLISFGAWLFMPGGYSEAFESMPTYWRATMPLIAVMIIGIGLYVLQPQRAQKLGIGHVIERLTNHQGQLPLANWLNQWWVGVISVLGGLSAGREGPAIHLGAGASSWIGEQLRLPHNSLRVLVACGTAAGISASFNTPIAGVIFAMEVVMMEYTLTGFMPVILASTMGAMVSQLFYGTEPAFAVPPQIIGRLVDIPWITVTALVIGMLAGGFIRLAGLAKQLDRYPWWLRLAGIGALTGMVAWWYPEVQGIGYDSVEVTLNGHPALDMLFAVALAKLILTALTLACGVPVGIIGPILVAGASAGALCGIAGVALLPALGADPNLYAMLGMAAMMGAVLQAPLAAIMALIELTHNPNIILYGMLAVVIAGLTSRQLWHCQGFFISTLAQQGMHPLQQPLMQALSRIAVPAVMERAIVRTQAEVSRAQAQKLLDANPVWLIISRNEGQEPVALVAADLARLLLDEHYQNMESIDLLDIPGKRLDLAPINLQATLSEAYDQLNEYGTDALYVEHTTAPMIRKISGIISREAIENYYRYRR